MRMAWPSAHPSRSPAAACAAAPPMTAESSSPSARPRGLFWFGGATRRHGQLAAAAHAPPLGRGDPRQRASARVGQLERGAGRIDSADFGAQRFGGRDCARVDCAVDVRARARRPHALADNALLAGRHRRAALGEVFRCTTISLCGTSVLAIRLPTRTALC